VGSGTRRRPIGRDYAAAKDAAFDKLRRGKVGRKEKVGRRIEKAAGKRSKKNYYHGTPRKITEKNLCYSVKISGEK
jgi:hypothetical protein